MQKEIEMRTAVLCVIETKNQKKYEICVNYRIKKLEYCHTKLIYYYCIFFLLLFIYTFHGQSSIDCSFKFIHGEGRREDYHFVSRFRHTSVRTLQMYEPNTK